MSTCPDADINPATPFIAMLLSVTTVSIPFPPAKVNVSPELNVSFVPESADKVNEVVMLEIFEALVAIPAANDADVETKDPEISDAI